ncbi:MAG: hypothetical protein CL678_05395 [Bdellovibrionaceae bacterium]|nr:hypothetical protein [Pseudobdellovibrionaceae bacterium]|tara:strand:- start:5158 stop:7050 length:1893 start_codon:yes stop_codon:yes gene_type:complete
MTKNKINSIFISILCVFTISLASCEREKEKPINPLTLDTKISTHPGGNLTCAIVGSSRKLSCWGQFQYNLTAATPEGYSPGPAGVVKSTPFFLTDETGKEVTDVRDVSIMPQAICAILIDGQMRCWGGMALGDTEALGVTLVLGLATGEVIPIPPLAEITHIAGAYNSLCVAGKSISDESFADTLICWGNGGNFGLNGYGDGTLSDQNSSTLSDAIENHPNGVPLPEGGIISLKGGGQHFCAILSSTSHEAGNAICWGVGSSGQLGYPNIYKNNIVAFRMVGYTNTPKDVGFIEFNGRLVKEIYPSDDITCALVTVPENDLLSSGVRCWGDALGSKISGYSLEELQEFAKPENFADLVIADTPAGQFLEQARAILAPLPYDVTLGFYKDMDPLLFNSLKKKNDTNSISNSLTSSTDDLTEKKKNLDLLIHAKLNAGRRALGKTSYLLNNISEAESIIGLKARQLGVGDHHACALMDPAPTPNSIYIYSSVRCWGRNDLGFINEQLTFGRFRSDYEGQNFIGSEEVSIADALDIPYPNYEGQLINGLSPIFDEIHAITVGQQHSCVVVYPDVEAYSNDFGSEDGWASDPKDNERGIKCWGRGDHGELGYGDNAIRPDMKDDFVMYYTAPKK